MRTCVTVYTQNMHHAVFSDREARGVQSEAINLLAAALLGNFTSTLFYHKIHLIAYI